MKDIKKSVLVLAISAILASTAIDIAYADREKESSDKKSESSDQSDNDKESSDKKNASSDNDARGADSEAKKISICHVPPGNPENKHTIHIGISAWPAHRDNHGGDYLGSCNNPPSTGSTTSSSTETLVTISDCKGEYRTTLVNLTQSYFDPVIVNDSALDDEDSVTAISECLDHGDSSDSAKSDSAKKAHKTAGHPDSGKGYGHDSVSDSGHHSISHCKNKDSSESHHKSGDSKESDSSKNYRKKLTEKHDKDNEAKKHSDSNLIISDSSKDDSGVKREYDKCLASGSEHKVDSGKGDSGHKYTVMKNCSNNSAIKEAVEQYREKVKNNKEYEQRPIFLNISSLSDSHIQAAVADCTDPGKGGGIRVDTPPDTTPPGGSGDTTPPGGGDTTPQGKQGRLNWKETIQQQ